MVIIFFPNGLLSRKTKELLFLLREELLRICAPANAGKSSIDWTSATASSSTLSVKILQS